ncbi:MAG: hypothetical protein AAF479_12990 [Pseudomonadota bacterium]
MYEATHPQALADDELDIAGGRGEWGLVIKEWETATAPTLSAKGGSEVAIEELTIAHEALRREH